MPVGHVALVVLPTKTTNTAANAVVAAKQSTRLAFAMTAKTTENSIVKRTILPSLASGLWTK